MLRLTSRYIAVGHRSVRWCLIAELQTIVARHRVRWVILALACYAEMGVQQERGTPTRVLTIARRKAHHHAIGQYEQHHYINKLMYKSLPR